MLGLPFKTRTGSALKLPLSLQLEDFRGRRIGEITTHANGADSQVFGADRQLLATLQDDDPDAVNAMRISLIDAQRQTVGRVEVPNMVLGILGRLQADVYAAGDARPRYTFTEDSLWLRMAYHALDMLPGVSALKGYLVRPSYTLRNAAGAAMVQLTKEGALLEGNCRVEPRGRIPPGDKDLIVLASLALAMVDFNQKGD